MGEGTPRATGQRWVKSIIPFKVADGTSGPVIPLYAHSLGLSLSQIGFMEAGFSLASIIGGFLWGRASDELRKRKAFLLLGFGGIAVVLLLLAFATTPAQLTALRVLHGFFLAAFVSVSVALLIERSRKERFGEDMGYLNMIGGYALIGGMALGAAALVFVDIPYLLLAAALLTLASLVVAFYAIEEPEAFLRRRDIHVLLADRFIPALNAFVQRRLFNPTSLVQRPRMTPVRRRILAYLLALFVAMLGGVATFALFPVLLLDAYGASPVQAILVLLAGSLFSAVLYRPVGRMADHLGFRRTLTLGLGLRTVVFVLMALSLVLVPSLLFVTGVNLLAGATWAFIMTAGPTALFRAMDVQRRGEMMGYYNLFMALGSAVGAIVGGLLAVFSGYLPLLVFSGVATGLSTVAIWRLNLE
ncbi:MAG: MFS transporter [candidate division NC10 bacterium]